MYREMAMQPHCVSCGVAQPSTRMEYAPTGGLWCWRCKVTAQIANHGRSPAERRAAAWRKALLIGGMLAGALILAYLVLAFASFSHGC